MEKKNNKIRAGETTKPPWKRPTLSMEFKSKTLAASFKKAEYDESEYDDYGVSADDFEQPLNKEVPTAVCTERNKEKDECRSEIDGNVSMDCLKNTTKANARVAGEISSRTSWMKDKVSNFWSRKGKQEENEMPENPRQCESDQQSYDNQSMSGSLNDSSSSNEKMHQNDNSSTHLAQANPFDEPSVEIKDGNKEKKQGRATTGWIRDQVSSLITKGKNYASGQTALAETNSNFESPANKSPKKQSSTIDDKDAKTSLAQSISEHYSLSQKGDGDSTVEMKTRGVMSVNFSSSEVSPKDESGTEADKFIDIHENINKSIVKQKETDESKEEQSAQDPDDRPLSPQVSNSTELKKQSTKSKIKGFLTPRPLTTDLTHIPLSPSSKDEKAKTGGNASTQTQSKMKFKFSGKLSFSELLQSQEHGSVENGSDPHNNESLSSSPIMDRFEEPISEDDEEECIIDTAKNNVVSSTNKPHNDATFFRLWYLAVFLYALYIIPMNSFITGAIIGALFMYLIGCLVVWLFCPSGKSFEQYRQELKKYLKEEESMSSAKKSVRTVDPGHLRKPKDLKGWVHFIIDYDPRVFTLDMTKDVFALLKGETLHIFFCKQQADNKPLSPRKLKKARRGLRGRRSKKAEPLKDQEPAFIFEKHHKISLPLCHLSLQPLDLPMRRIWNRKYPIRIDIPPNAMLVKDIEVPFEDLTSNFEKYVESSDGDWVKNKHDEQFHILPNTAREKEDWFYRMQLCNKPLKHQITLRDVQRGTLSNRAADSYPHYMVECIREGEKITSRVANGKRLEPHTAWLNVLLGRAFWDVWHEPYWKRKVWLKIQSRLNKLNTPPIIKEIYVKDLHLGHTLPVIHKGSLPELDEYGVWTDLQVTYQGEFTLTLETQLNVDYYVALLTKLAKQQIQAQDTPNTDVRMKFSRDKGSVDGLDTGLAADSETADFEGENVLTDQLPEIFLEAINQVEEDEEDLGGALDDDPMISDPRTKAFLESKTGKRVAGIVGWLARSKIAKKVAETDFAKKAYEKAYEKFRKMPIILKVTVQSLRGTLAVNIAPPPTNRVWFGFRGTPAVLLTAHPKLGDRHVRLTYLTDWIERKLKDEFKKLFVLPSMQDLSVKLMYSRLEELYPDRPLS